MLHLISAPDGLLTKISELDLALLAAPECAALALLLLRYTHVV